MRAIGWGRVLRAAAAVVAFALCTACSDSEGGGAESLGIDDGASKGESKSLLVKATESAELTLKTGARLSIPPGALDKDLEISMKRPPDSEAAALVNKVGDEYRIASAPYVLTPHGTMFQKDVVLELPIAKANKDQLVVGWLENERDKNWKVLGPAAPEGDKARVLLKHFSVLVLLERTAGAVDVDAGSGPDDELDAGRGAEAGATADAGRGSAADAGEISPDAGAFIDATDGIGCERTIEYGACAAGQSFCTGPFTSYTCSDGHTYAWNFGSIQDGMCQLQCEIDGQPAGPSCGYESHDCDSDDPLVVCPLDCPFPSYVGAQELRDRDPVDIDASTGNGGAAADASAPDTGTGGGGDGATDVSCEVRVDYGACAPGYSFCVGPFTTYTCSDGHTYAWNFGSIQDGMCQLQCEVDGEPAGGPTCDYPSHDCDMPGPLSVCGMDCGFPSYVGPQVRSSDEPASDGGATGI